jgi:hypothetical protein
MIAKKKPYMAFSCASVENHEVAYLQILTLDGHTYIKPATRQARVSQVHYILVAHRNSAGIDETTAPC